MHYQTLMIIALSKTLSMDNQGHGYEKSRSLDLTPLDFFLWEKLKVDVTHQLLKKT